MYVGTSSRQDVRWDPKVSFVPTKPSTRSLGLSSLVNYLFLRLRVSYLVVKSLTQSLKV